MNKYLCKFEIEKEIEAKDEDDAMSEFAYYISSSIYEDDITIEEVEQ
jgi:hypothetical protein